KRMLFASIGVDSAEFDSLRPLLDAIEPTKWYSRLLGAAALQARVAGSPAPGEGPHTTATPRDVVVHFLDPASPCGCDIGPALRAVVDETADDEDRKLLIETAAGWRRQREAVRSIGARVPAVAELESISQRLASLAEVIEAALTERVGATHRATLNAAKD